VWQRGIGRVKQGRSGCGFGAGFCDFAFASCLHSEGQC
jgi:hypothetical protein